MLLINSTFNCYSLLINGIEYPLFNKLKRDWHIHQSCQPSDYVALGYGTNVLSSKDPISLKYLADFTTYIEASESPLSLSSL